jgi:hypothetical protein
METEQHEECLQSVRERRKKKKTTETNSEREDRQNRENKCKRAARKRKRNENRNVLELQNETEQIQHDQEQQVKREETYNLDSQPISHSATTINEEEISMLQDFRRKMDDIRYNICKVCKERIPSLTLQKHPNVNNRT